MAIFRHFLGSHGTLPENPEDPGYAPKGSPGPSERGHRQRQLPAAAAPAARLPKPRLGPAMVELPSGKPTKSYRKTIGKR